VSIGSETIADRQDRVLQQVVGGVAPIIVTPKVHLLFEGLRSAARGFTPHLHAGVQHLTIDERIISACGVVLPRQLELLLGAAMQHFSVVHTSYGSDHGSFEALRNQANAKEMPNAVRKSQGSHVALTVHKVAIGDVTLRCRERKFRSMSTRP